MIVRAGLVEHRRDDRDVRQMRAAVERVVQRDHVARLQRGAAIVQHGAHAFAHRAEMHRHVRRVRHQEALGVEDGAGEVQPLLDVDAHRRVLQHRTGLLGHVHEQVVEQLEQHRIGPAAAGRHARREPFGAAQRHVIERGDLRRPAWFHHGGGVGLADQCRARRCGHPPADRSDRTPARCDPCRR